MGCFTMVISLEDSFRSFAEHIINIEAKEMPEWVEMRQYNVQGIDATVAKYIDFFKSTVSGLEIIFSPTKYDNDDSAYLGDWKAKSSNGRAEISDTNCNN